MKKRLIALLFALSLLLTALPPAQADDKVLISSLEELKQYLRIHALSLSETIEFSYVAELDEAADPSGRLVDLLFNNGIANYDVKHNKKTRAVRLSDIVYRSGFRIARLWRAGLTGDLTEDERDTLLIAQNIAREALSLSNTLLETERIIHDAICRAAAYEQVSGSKMATHDTAVGALKYGRAECDGYADAFYLIGTLAGLDVDYQYGDVINPRSGKSGPHLWNKVRIGNSWYHLDMTNNDLNYSKDSRICSYLCFNLGSGMMHSYRWEEELSFHEAAVNNNWNVYFYTCGLEGFGAYFESLEDAARYAVNLWKAGAYGVHVMVKAGPDKDASLFNKELKRQLSETDFRSAWLTWTGNLSEYICFDVLFTR